ncbi:Protein phosphatase 2C [Artemisia annua]|uniref:Protein phosphatase 2C n=1 Tax=Artemisia annua TaxID=35608 RepID=A0A2U1KZ06_ARTAN|nr:Protein phosphatase 2C [Artemisia annua]
MEHFQGSVIIVASVGDSRCILESAEGGLYYLSADHRLDCSEEERERVTASGGEVGQLNAGGGTQRLCYVVILIETYGMGEQRLCSSRNSIIVSKETPMN